MVQDILGHPVKMQIAQHLLSKYIMQSAYNCFKTQYIQYNSVNAYHFFPLLTSFLFLMIQVPVMNTKSINISYLCSNLPFFNNALTRLLFVVTWFSFLKFSSRWNWRSQFLCIIRCSTAFSYFPERLSPCWCRFCHRNKSPWSFYAQTTLLFLVWS